MDAEFKQLLAERRFMRYWLARLCTHAGVQMLMVAMGWQMYELTHSAWDLGLVGLCQFLPVLLLSLPAGHLADRVSRRYIILTFSALSVLVVSALAWASWQHLSTRELLLCMSVVIGVIRGFQSPAQQALLPQLVPRPLLQRATAFSTAGTQTAIIVGPALGGLLFFAGAEVVYGVSALLYVGTFYALKGIRGIPNHLSAAPATWSSLFAGVRFIGQHKTLLGGVSLDLFAVMLGGATALLPMYAKDILMVGPVGLGFLRAAPAVGALILSVVLTKWPLRRRVGRKLLWAVGLYGVCMVVFGLSTSFVLSFLALLCSGMADMVGVVIRSSLIQLETPDHMRGRVSAVNATFIGASNQLGEFESGAAAAWLGPVGAVVAGGLGTICVVALWFKLFPSLARRDRLA
jgi:MFS family permease